LARVLRLAVPPDLVVAGRTDAGVHARGQVVHLDVAADVFAALPGRSLSIPSESLVTRLAGVLPHDLVVRQARVVPDAFDARFGAVERRYCYRVCDTAHRPDPLHRSHVLWAREPLDPAAMHRAGQPLLGEHDFVAFCRPRPGATTVRRMHRLTVSRDQSGLVVVEVAADAFCHHQVRALTGALLAVGAGRREESWPAQVLGAGRRDGAVQVAPAHGLTLEQVQYPPDDGLAEQAARARTLRGAPR
jgi:tRNA pseudouridine38-40 synthase